MEKKERIVYKIIVIGEELTGKSTFIRTFLNIHCNWNLKYLETHYFTSEFEIKLSKSAIQRKGSREYSAFYRSAAGFLILFSLSDRYSFTCLESWFDLLSELKINKINKVLIVGTKSDLTNKRQVSFEEVQELLSKYDLNYMELSANDSDQIELALGILINTIIFNSQSELHKITNH